MLLPDFLGPLIMHIGTDKKSVSALGVESTYAASHDGGSINGRTSLEPSDISRMKQRWYEIVRISTITYKMHCGNPNVNCSGVPWRLKDVFEDPTHPAQIMHASILGLN